MSKKKIKKGAGPVRVSKISTFDLLAYIDMNGQIQATLGNFGNHIMENQGYGGIDAKDSMGILDDVNAHIAHYGELQKEISHVLGSRYKRDLGATKDVVGIDKWIMGIGDKYPILKEDMDKLAKAWDEKQSAQFQEDELKKLSDAKMAVVEGSDVIEDKELNPKTK